MVKPYGPNERPDSNPPNPNVIRRFREELRLSRHEFADLLEANVDTLRVWETDGRSKPRGPAAAKIIEVAQRNQYPLTMADIYPADSLSKKKKKSGVAKLKQKA